MDEKEKNQAIEMAVRYLLDGGDEDAAKVLLACEIDVWSDAHEGVVYLTCPRHTFDLLTTDEDLENRIRRSFMVPLNFFSTDDVIIVPLYKSLKIYPGWYKEILSRADSERIDNQAVTENKDENVLIWQNLRFRSKSEIKIAEALDQKKGVLFLPNCRARLGFKVRENREVDFLVCYRGKWGILEVDGAPYHPATRASEDHARDDLFQAHGIKLVKHYDANECYEKPEEVVKKFLYLLERI